MRRFAGVLVFVAVLLGLGTLAAYLYDESYDWEESPFGLRLVPFVVAYELAMREMAADGSMELLSCKTSLVHAGAHGSWITEGKLVEARSPSDCAHPALVRNSSTCTFWFNLLRKCAVVAFPAWARRLPALDYHVGQALKDPCAYQRQDFVLWAYDRRLHASAIPWKPASKPPEVPPLKFDYCRHKINLTLLWI